MEALKLSEFKFFKKENKIQVVPICQIRPNPYQSRKYFHFSGLEELAESIKQHGLLQPILIRKIGATYYEVIAGERRLRACELAGYVSISAVVCNVNDQESALLAMVENLQRESLNFMEEADAYQNILEDYHMTQEELSEKIAKNHSFISNKVRLLKLGETVKKKLIQYQLSERHGRAIVKIPEESIQLALVEQIAEGDLTVKQTEDLVAETLERLCQPKLERHIKREKRYITDLRLFTNSIRQSIDILKKSGMFVSYENKEKEDGCEIVIRIRK